MIKLHHKELDKLHTSLLLYKFYIAMRTENKILIAPDNSAAFWRSHLKSYLSSGHKGGGGCGRF